MPVYSVRRTPLPKTRLPPKDQAAVLHSSARRTLSFAQSASCKEFRAKDVKDAE